MDGISDGSIARVEAEHVPEDEVRPGLRSERDEGVGVRERARDGLLAEDREAALERGLDRRPVMLWRRDDDDGLQAGRVQGLVQVRHERHPRRHPLARGGSTSHATTRSAAADAARIAACSPPHHADADERAADAPGHRSGRPMSAAAVAR